MALDISTFVDITTQVAAGGVPLERFGRGLLITTDDALSAGGSGKVQLYTTLNGFSGDFDAGDAMDAASVWFSADPIPQGLWVGRWADVRTRIHVVDGRCARTGCRLYRRQLLVCHQRHERNRH